MFDQIRPHSLALQLGLLSLCCWAAVRLVIRPLDKLAKAADALGPDNSAPRLDEQGPIEVAHAATAFNAMRDRLAGYLQERMQILAAISHDLQTPITRMKLRVEVGDDGIERGKLLKDLIELEQLVHEGIAYARSANGNAEKSSSIEIGSFVESLVFDYQDTGKNVRLTETVEAITVTRPQALRRILTNLIDNALKFAGEADVQIKYLGGKVAIQILDRGPGIPEEKLDSVLQPFVRLEESRNRDTGGAGLGLAIAKQLVQAIGGVMQLDNRNGGGLSVIIILDNR